MATDSVVIRSSDATDLQINLESFTKVYRVFVCALSKAEGNLPLISAKIVALSLKLLQTPILPRYLVHVPHNTLERISKGLLDLLLRFDDLLDNSIVGHIFFQALPGRGSMRLEVETRYTKLNSLEDLISFRYMQLAASPPASSSEGLHGLSDQSLSSFVRFNLVDCEWEVATIGILAVLTREVALLHLHDTHEATTSNSSAGVSESTTAGLAEAQRAQEFYKRSTLLFKKLSKNMGSCKTGHTAKVNLSGFGVCKPDLKMLLSTCPDPKPNSWGHPATCSEQSSPNMQQIKPLNVCKYLRDSIKRQKPISIYCSQGSIWKGYAPVGERLKGRALESSYKTLGDLFQGNHPSTSESQRRKYLELSNRRRLQCLLAQSLLHLYQSPWLPDVWDLDSVIFAHEQSSFSIKEPHSPCDLCLPSSSEQDNPKDPHIEPDMRTFMIKFGFLLLQIERQQRLELSEEEKLEDFGHDIALHRYLKELSGSVEEPFQKVLRSCLDFDECVDQIKLSISDDLKCRLAIFKLILAPLMEILAFSFPNVAAEISPMQAQEAPRNATVESVGHGLVDPTGRNQSTQDSQLQSTQGKLKQSSGGRGQVLATNTHRTAAIKSRESDSVDSWHEPECREEDDVSSDAESPLSGEAGNLFAVFDAYTSGSKSPTATTTFKMIERIYNTRFQYNEDDESVKIAILDTGVDLKHEDLQQPRSKFSTGKFPNPITGEPKQIDRIKAYKNFCDDRDDDNDVDDIDGHGTYVAGIVLRLAPRAELLIARVCEGDKDYAGLTKNTEQDKRMKKQTAQKKIVDPRRVETAIDWAIQHEVHLINISFGFLEFTDDHWNLDEALERAQKAGIVIFAAASNNGNHSPVAWPARDSGHTICIHSCDDGGKRSSVFTPGVDPNTTNFMAIGENVRSHWPSSKGGGWHVMSGSSTATPVATAIGALLLAFINQSHWQEQRRTVENSVRLKRLRKVRCMTDLLKKISDQKVDGYYWIHSSLLWKDYKPDAEKRKDPASAADHAWEQIRLALLK